MSFQNTITENGISINVIPSIGRIVQLPETNRTTIINEVQNWRSKKVLNTPPPGFDPSRYVSFSSVEKVENPVSADQIHQYVENSRLARRIR